MRVRTAHRVDSEARTTEPRGFSDSFQGRVISQVGLTKEQKVEAAPFSQRQRIDQVALRSTDVVRLESDLVQRRAAAGLSATGTVNCGSPPDGSCCSEGCLTSARWERRRSRWWGSLAGAPSVPSETAASLTATRRQWGGRGGWGGGHRRADCDSHSTTTTSTPATPRSWSLEATTACCALRGIMLDSGRQVCDWELATRKESGCVAGFIAAPLRLCSVRENSGAHRRPVLATAATSTAATARLLARWLSAWARGGGRRAGS